MPRGYPKLHLFWLAPPTGFLYKTACGKLLRDVQVTTRLNEVTCKTCRATVYGRPDKDPQ